MRLFGSLKQILVSTYLLVTLLPLLVLGGFSHFSVKHTVEQEIREKHRLVSLALAGEVNSIISKAHTILEYAGDLVEQDPAQIEHLLSPLLQRYVFFEGIQLLDESGQVLLVLPDIPGYVGLDMSGQVFFSQAYEQAGPYWSRSHISFETGDPTVSLSLVTNQGLLVGSINLSMLNEVVAQIELGETGYAKITDNEGWLIAHQKASLVQERCNFSNMLPCFYSQANKENNSLVENCFVDLPDLIGFSVAIKQTGWVVTVLQDRQDAYKAVADIIVALVAFFIATAMVGSIVAYTIYASILTPIDRLIKQSGRIAAGDFSFSFKPESYLEVNLLAQAFCSMSEALHNRELNLKENKQRLDLALEGAELGIWEYDMSAHDIRVDKRWEQLTGYNMGGVLKAGHVFRNLIHPQDRNTVIKAFNKHRKGKKPNYESETRVKTADNRWMWFLIRGRITQRDQKGGPLKAAGSYLEITAQKAVEGRLLLSLQEKETLLQEVHHRVKNNFQLIISLLNMQGHGLKDDTLITAFDDAKNRIRSMALIHEQIYSSEHLAHIDFDMYVENICRELFSAFMGAKQGFVLEIFNDPIKLSIEQAIPCALVLNELLTNAFKYAYPDENNTQKQGCIIINNTPTDNTITGSRNMAGTSAPAAGAAPASVAAGTSGTAGMASSAGTANTDGTESRAATNESNFDKAKIIRAGIKKLEQQWVEIFVEDRGVGKETLLDKDNETSRLQVREAANRNYATAKHEKSLGLSLVEELTAQLRGDVKYNHQKGTKVTVRFRQPANIS